MSDSIEIKTNVAEASESESITYTEEQLKKSYCGFYNVVVKRVADFCIALVGTAIISPLILIVALCIAIESGFPVLYKPLRGGYKNKPFHILKFRSMVKDADKIGGGTTALNDSRITRVGLFLRKTKLDEITQVLNVLCGKMSFIGPRPELLKYTDAYDGIYKNILNVRPGITDFSSVYLINLDEIVGTENADEMYEKYVLKKKNNLRLKYVAEVSFFTDIKLFFITVFNVIKKALSFLFKKGSK